MSTLQISLPDGLHAFAQTQAREEGFNNASDYIAHLLHEAALWAEADKKSPEQKRTALAALLNESLQGEAIPLTGEVWAGFLGEVDEKARKQGLQSNLRAAFLEDTPALEEASATQVPVAAAA